MQFSRKKSFLDGAAFLLKSRMQNNWLSNESPQHGTVLRPKRLERPVPFQLFSSACKRLRNQLMGALVSVLDIFASVVLIVLICTVIALFVFLAMLPGRIARQRNHPQHEAVNMAGWLGAIALGVFWPLALVWAFYVSPGQDLSKTDEEAVS